MVESNYLRREVRVYWKYRPLFRLNILEAFFLMGRTLNLDEGTLESQWGDAKSRLLILDGVMRPHHNLSTAYIAT